MSELHTSTSPFKDDEGHNDDTPMWALSPFVVSSTDGGYRSITPGGRRFGTVESSSVDWPDDLWWSESVECGVSKLKAVLPAVGAAIGEGVMTVFVTGVFDSSPSMFLDAENRVVTPRGCRLLDDGCCDDDDDDGKDDVFLRLLLFGPVPLSAAEDAGPAEVILIAVEGPDDGLRFFLFGTSTAIATTNPCLSSLT